MSHAARAVLMVKPTDFEYNVETATDNEFMHVDLLNSSGVRSTAMSEFSNTVRILRSLGIRTIVFDKTMHVDLHAEKMPDAVFPNNWFSTDTNGRVIIYPMAATSRNREKQAFRFMIEELLRYFKIESVRNFAPGCEDGVALEGTGALLIDRHKRRVYCNRSKRADEALLKEWAAENNYTPIAFDSRSSSGQSFYHTNVLLSIGDRFAVICADAIVPEDREKVLALLREDREVICITLAQAENHFCANILELSNDKGQSVIVMSSSAYDGFTEEQRAKLQSFGELAVCPIPTIEKVGGGSARCILAEIFLEPVKSD